MGIKPGIIWPGQLGIYSIRPRLKPIPQPPLTPLPHSIGTSMVPSLTIQKYSTLVILECPITFLQLDSF